MRGWNAALAGLAEAVRLGTEQHRFLTGLRDPTPSG
jgi:hypothetical protein